MLPPLSVLDLAPVGAGSTASQAIRHTVELARLAERLGYVRFWLAEHHGMPNIASSAPEILIEHVASATERIRVGSGGIMLPNHAPLRIAEAFHTLEALHPGRIDLGMGRAPGTDPATSSALRPFDAEQFPQQLAELFALSRREYPAGHPFHKVRVVPADVELPPVWLLGSSGASARLAGSLGVGYGFASHFSPRSRPTARPSSRRSGSRGRT
jgi:luciferase family oxidoreductase group 1